MKSEPSTTEVFLPLRTPATDKPRPCTTEILLSVCPAATPFPMDHTGASSATMIMANGAPVVSMERAGESIGRYRLIRELGGGGFGIVWQAEQSEPIRREVALKVIKPGMDSREIIARFEAERQALAMMDHSNIASVLEAGATDTGRPYFAMELVHGAPITDYCDERRFTLRQRLELFIPVCLAVQHAHQKSILHRDLKPSNILVAEIDGRPAPKVIDFGIAKALGSSAEALLQSTFARTQEGAIIGTPQYMSPEQAGATKDLDTRSDIYTLGVILYELLTGHTPLLREDLGNAAMDEVLRLVREDEAARPSSRLSPITDGMREISGARGTDPVRLSRALRGDLDWITLKALEKERERRYESAAALAQDLERHLNNEPVAAGRPSAIYRLRKLVRRNRTAVAASLAIVLLLIAGVAASTWQAFRATRAEVLATDRLRQVAAEKARADAEGDIAKGVNEFLQRDLLAQTGSRSQANTRAKPKPNLTMKEALDRASNRIESRFRAQPLVEAAIQSTLGRTYLDLGDASSALPHLQRATHLQSEQLGAEDPQSLSSRNDLANALQAQGKYADAEREHRAVLAVRQRVLGADHPDTMGSRNDLANALRAQGKFAEAVQELREVLKARERVLGAEHRNTLDSRNDLANTLQAQGNFAEAEQEHRAILAVRQRVLGAEHPDTLQSRNNLAIVLQAEAKFAEAEREYRAVLAIQTRVLGAEHTDTLVIRSNLAFTLQRQAKYAEAEKENREVLAIRQRVLGTAHPHTLIGWSNLAETLNAEGKHAEAEQELRAVLAIRQRVLGAQHPDTLDSRTNLALTLQTESKHAEAEQELRAILAARAQSGDPDNPASHTCCLILARCLESQGRIGEALEFARQAEAGRKKTLGPGHPDSMAAQRTRERIEAKLGK